MYKKSVAFILSIFFVFALTGCSSDGAQLKQDLQNALEKQSEITNYSFDGDLDVKLGTNTAPADAKDHPGTAFLKGLLNSQIQWEGLADQEQAQLQMSLSLHPHESDVTTTIPLLIKDNKFYFSLPIMNKPGEYWSINLGELSEHDKAPAKNIISDVLAPVIDGLNEDWFTKKEDDNEAVKTVVIQITQENLLSFAASLKEQLPAALKNVQTSGYLTDSWAKALKDTLNKPETTDYVKQMKLSKPGAIAFTINKQGWISQMELNLKYSVKEQQDQSIHFVYSFDHINEGQKFTKEIPKEVFPFDDVLKMLEPDQEQKK